MKITWRKVLRAQHRPIDLARVEVDGRLMYQAVCWCGRKALVGSRMATQKDQRAHRQQMLTKPTPKICPVCGDRTDWVWDEKDQEWELDGEWWFDPLAPDPKSGFVDSFHCWRRRHEQKVKAA